MSEEAQCSYCMHEPKPQPHRLTPSHHPPTSADSTRMGDLHWTAQWAVADDTRGVDAPIDMRGYDPEQAHIRHAGRNVQAAPGQALPTPNKTAPVRVCRRQQQYLAYYHAHGVSVVKAQPDVGRSHAECRQTRGQVGGAEGQQLVLPPAVHMRTEFYLAVEPRRAIVYSSAKVLSLWTTAVGTLFSVTCSTSNIMRLHHRPSH